MISINCINLGEMSPLYVYKSAFIVTYPLLISQQFRIWSTNMRLNDHPFSS